MSTMYSTITQKGQITLPAEWRRKLGLEPGLRISMREVAGTIVIDSPQDMAAVRAQAKREMQTAGTWGAPIDTSAVWTTVANEKLAN